MTGELAILSAQERYQFLDVKVIPFEGGPLGDTRWGSACIQQLPADRMIRLFRAVGDEIEELVYEIVARNGELVAVYRG